MMQPPQTLTLPVAENQRRERIDLYLTQRLPNVSRSRIKQLINAGMVSINSHTIKPSHLISPGEIITIYLQPRPGPSFEPENIPLNIVYEDENVIVINKPAGLVVHPAQGNWSGTLMNALLGYNRQLLDLGQEFRAGLVHRLDKDTTGLMVAAKDQFTLSELGRQFREREVERSYIALVWGHPLKSNGVIEESLGRSQSDRKIYAVRPDGKPAVTNYRVLGKFELFALLELKLMTGRTHQIRVHLSHIGHPLFGDPAYGGRNARFGKLSQEQRIKCDFLLNIMKRQALHAKTLGFLHPVKRIHMYFESELPQDFLTLLKELKQAD